jgi:sterol desaturase/sphingolipid hydroxylase (fatty acid hydroxylase superfamily)
MDWNSLAVVSSVLLFGLLENNFPFFEFKQSFNQRTYPNLLLGCVNVVANSVTIAFLLNWIWQQTFWRGFLQFVQSPILAIAISFLLLDAYLYLWHRLMHSNRLTWRFHQVHHTEISMNTSTAYRFHTVEVILSNIPKLFLVWLFGIKLNYLFVYEITLAIGLIFHHSNLALPWKLDKCLSYLIVTPNFHRSHHSQVFASTQTNYASLLTIWDRLFQTCYYPKYPDKIDLGLPEYPKNLNVLQLILLPFKSEKREKSNSLLS